MLARRCYRHAYHRLAMMSVKAYTLPIGASGDAVVSLRCQVVRAFACKCQRNTHLGTAESVTVPHQLGPDIVLPSAYSSPFSPVLKTWRPHMRTPFLCAPSHSLVVPSFCHRYKVLTLFTTQVTVYVDLPFWSGRRRVTTRHDNMRLASKKRGTGVQVSRLADSEK